MKIILIIILIILCIISLIKIFFHSRDDLNDIAIIFLLFNYTSLIFVIISYIYIDPIEVYRGNTELEITYRNNIPIDSTVIWKQK